MTEKTDVIAASMIGTIIEWYGIFIFSSGAIYIERAFYPTVSLAEGLLLVLLTFALGFVTRPVGAYVFGHFGDKLGRKRILLLTLLISGISTGLTGLIPSEATIGTLAIVLLVILRLVLGFGLGGEWGGAMLLTLETFKKRRGFYSSFVQSTVGIGLLLGTAIFIPLVYLLPSSFMYSIGWRIPFLASFVIVIVGVFIRLKVKETPVFEAEKKKNKLLKSPEKELFTKHWKEVIVGTLLAGSSGNFFYFAISLLPVLFEDTGKISVLVGLIGTAVFGILDVIFVFIGGQISDKRGRRVIIAGANLLALIVLFPSIYLVGTAYFILFLSLFAVAHGLSYSPMGAMISEIFPTRVRYSGNSASYQYGNSFIGGPAPYVSDLLGTLEYALYPVFTLIFILIALGVIYKSKETDNVSLEESDIGPDSIT
jgi:MHS family shikimate/dehydroshikimate transporter-like MFS transporter